MVMHGKVALAVVKLVMILFAAVNLVGLVYSWLWCIKVEVHLNVVQFAMLHLVLVGFGTVVCS